MDEPEIGFANIQLRMDDQDVRDIMFDFFTALALSNRGPDSTPITDVATYNFLPTQIDPGTGRVRGADMFGSFRDMFYLSGPSMATLGSNDGEVWSSGVQYLTFTASGIADLTVTVDPEAEARLRIARLQ